MYYVSAHEYTTYIYICLTSPHGQDLTQGQLYAEFDRFEFKVFLLLDKLFNQSQRTQLEGEQLDSYFFAGY